MRFALSSMSKFDTPVTFPRPRQLLDETGPDWIGRPGHDDRDGRSRQLCGVSFGSIRGVDDLHPGLREFGGQIGQPPLHAVCMLELDEQILPLDPAEVGQLLPPGLDARPRRHRRQCRAQIQDADSANTSRLADQRRDDPASAKQGGADNGGTRLQELAAVQDIAQNGLLANYQRLARPQSSRHLAAEM
jgi:hypothetical protein